MGFYDSIDDNFISLFVAGSISYSLSQAGLQIFGLRTFWEQRL
jgi:hypothetical protein